MKTITQYILEIERLPLNNYLIEAQSDGLKDVKIIRHYTTGAGLKSILKDGYIEAKESKGDEDWEAYDLFDKKVVSFHDARTDPEWNTFIKANNKGVSMEGTTPTLGLHDKKVCACIEIDYEKLPELMQQKTHLLNIYGEKAENFANYWNCYVDETVKDKNGIVAWYACRADVLQLCKDISEGKYLEGINEAIGYYFDIEPYKTYKEYFNVYTVVGLSPDSGVGTVNTIRESRFGTQYTLNAGLAPREDLCFEAACLAPINDDVSRTLIVMIENSEDYGGVSYMWGDGSAISLCSMSRDLYPYDFRGLIQHEAGGHGFGKLGDEYIYHNAFISSCSCPCCPHVYEFNIYKAYGWFDNLSLDGNIHGVPWAHLFFDEQFQNTVDIYEGGYMHTRGVFRSEPNSCMNNNIPYYSAISRESIVKRIMKYAGMEYSFESFKENDVLTLVPKVETKSVILDNIVSYPKNQQRPPVYMGDKPNFKK